MTFNIANEDLATADLTAETAGLTTLEKVEWSYIYTHRAANRQGDLLKLYVAGKVGYLGYEVDLPAQTVINIKAEINALADRIVTSQTFVAGVTD